MGKEFASATARWCHLPRMALRPEVTAICSAHPSPERTRWYTENFPTIRRVTDDYREVLQSGDVDAVYIAVPHNLHEEIFVAAVAAGKHVLGEKPFGIDLKANEAILAAIRAHPACLARCASQYIFYPAAQRILRMFDQNAFGRILAVDGEFSHSSDLNPDKPINWKRKNAFNGEYGVMGDLGVHLALVPARAGWALDNVRAICSKIISQRPDGQGGMAPCETWDNATLLAQLRDAATGDAFPLSLALNRIRPGEKNTWRIAVYGTKACARFSLKNPRRLELLEYRGGEQAWQQIDMGFETAYETITGGIFEFGSVDAFMQMMASFLYELEHGKPLSRAAACPTPEETHWCHRLFTAALESNRTGKTAQG